MSRPDRPARRAAQPALMPLEGRQLLTAGAATRPLALQVVHSAVPEGPAVVSRAFAPLAPPTATAVVASRSIMRFVAPHAVAPSLTSTSYVVAPSVASTPGVAVHFGQAPLLIYHTPVRSV